MASQSASSAPQAAALDAEPPGLVLYVGLNADSKDSGTTLLELMEILQEFAHEIAPQSRTMAALVTRSDGPTAEALAAVRRALSQGSAAPVNNARGGKAALTPAINRA